MNPLGDAILQAGQERRSNVQGPAICQAANTIITCTCVCRQACLTVNYTLRFSRINVLLLEAQSTSPPSPTVGDTVL